MKKILALSIMTILSVTAIFAQDTTMHKRPLTKNPYDTMPANADSSKYNKKGNDKNKMPNDKRKKHWPDSFNNRPDSLKKFNQ